MKKTRKWISLLCAMVMVFTMLAVPAGAVSTNPLDAETYMEEIDGGHMFLYLSEAEAATILTNDEQHIVNISLRYNQDADTVYEWSFSDYPVSEFEPECQDFWLEIIEYAKARIGLATVIHFTTITYDEGTDFPQPYSSATADLFEDLKEITGLSEYYQKLKTTIIDNGQTFRVYEEVTFLNTLVGLKSWANAMNVASFITSVLGILPLAETVSVVCNVFSLTISTASIIAAGQMNEYLTVARTCRYVTINGSAYVYNTVYKYNNFHGYENADERNTERAYLNPDTEEIQYSNYNGQTYFDSYQSQVNDAYNTFKILGQKP